MTIPFASMLKILGHFSNTLPVVFLYLLPGAAAAIRKQLRMTDKNKFYFDSGSVGKTRTFFF